MKYFFLFFLSLKSVSLCAQDITGKWYSSDSSRVYKIYKPGDYYEAIVLHTFQKNDHSDGRIILKDLAYIPKKKKYIGTIYAIRDSTNTSTIIRFDKKDSRILKLRLKRMFIMDINLKWYRADDFIMHYQ